MENRVTTQLGSPAHDTGVWLENAPLANNYIRV